MFPDAYASAAERDAAYEKAVLAVRDAAAKFGGNQAEVAERWARAQIDESGSWTERVWIERVPLCKGLLLPIGIPAHA